MDRYKLEELEKVKKYNECIGDLKKPIELYANMPIKMAEAFFRGRANILDPAPRGADDVNKWRCKFCYAHCQDSKHFILECAGTEHLFSDQSQREEVWKTMRGEGELSTMSCASKLLEIRRLLLEDKKKKDYSHITFESKDCITQ